MRCVVVGAGAWGLPAAAELAGRGHDVVLVDRYGVANRLSSSPGPTRLWRLTHPDRVRVRLARRSVEAMERLASRCGEPVFLRRGLLWRDDSPRCVADALAAEGVPHEVVAAAEVARFFPGLRPDGRDAVWQVDAGTVLAAVSMRAQAALFARAGGASVFGRVAREVRTTPGGVRVVFADGGFLDADTAVLAPGPGAAALLATVGVDLALRSRLEQVSHFGRPAQTGALPCLIDGPDLGVYAMPTPGVGYKVGLSHRERDLVEGDEDRTPDPARVRATADYVRATLTAVDPEPLDAQVCSMTDAPDGRFVIDSLPGGIAIACGDCGEGFKFSALIGIVLADLAEGATPDADVAVFGLRRFAASTPG
jgi:glycine/D-amino acid oxidase-like deaminating enzyme